MTFDMHSGRFWNKSYVMEIPYKDICAHVYFPQEKIFIEVLSSR